MLLLGHRPFIIEGMSGKEIRIIKIQIAKINLVYLYLFFSFLKLFSN